MRRFAESFGSVVDNIERVVHGKTDAISLALTCLFAGGHLLIEDVPGVGKTTIARCMAASLRASVSRIQFTPDLLPSDITGVNIYRPRDDEFVFHPGPVFAHVVIADEINRASPKTQSALLEVMEEGRVTTDGEARPVPQPFLVVATQNPIDMDGTYALPEAQLDRFLIRMSVGYPDRAAETAVLRARRSGVRPEELTPVLSPPDVLGLIGEAATVHVSEELRGYIVDVVAATRRMPRLRLGASPRGSLALTRTAQVRAAADGRDFVEPADVKVLAPAVLGHRVLLSADAELQGATSEDVIAEALDRVPVPRSLQTA